MSVHSKGTYDEHICHMYTKWLINFKRGVFNDIKEQGFWGGEEFYHIVSPS